MAAIYVLADYRERLNYARSLRAQLTAFRAELAEFPGPERTRQILAVIRKLQGQLRDVGRVSA